MHLEQLKKGLWGYRKDSVFQYIASQEEVFSQKLLEKDAQAEGAARQYQERIQALEEENRKLRQDLEEYRQKCDMISDALLDARSCAAQMKEESRALESEAQERIRQALEQELEQVAQYKEKVAALRCNIQATLAALDYKAAELEEQAQQLSDASPDGNLSLFQ